MFETEAKALYGIWAHKTNNDPTAFERLPVVHQEAWCDIVQFATEEQECPMCGGMLQCPLCDDFDIGDEDEDEAEDAIPGVVAAVARKAS
jgi:hypothetical protein